MQSALARCRLPFQTGAAATSAAALAPSHRVASAAVATVQRVHARRMQQLQPPCRALSYSHALHAAAAASAATPAAVASAQSASTTPARSASAVYTEQRQKELQEAGMCDEAGNFTYPNQLQPSITIPEFIERYSSLKAGERAEGVEICLAGRLSSKRDSSSKLKFYDLVGGGAGSSDYEFPTANEEGVAATPAAPTFSQVQLMASRASHTGPATCSSPADEASLHASFARLHHALKKGDIVWARGIPAKSKVGQLSLLVKDVQLLTPCWHEIPAKLTEPNIRYRQRYLDMLVNRDPSGLLSTMALRSRVLLALRAFLVNQHNFTEVETPILWTSHGGATAKPFTTSSTALGSAAGQPDKPLPLFLRIAPELFLKQLVIGGLERVFEVSKVFRNEGMDPTHNPEFTTVEFYMAHANYKHVMHITEQMLPILAKAALGGGAAAAIVSGGRTSVPAVNKFTGARVTIDLSAAPYRRIDIMDGLAAALSLSSSSELPDPNSDASLPWYLEACARKGVKVNSPQTLPRVLDALIGGLLEPQCIQPTFLMHHPVCLSPLARLHPTRPGLTERFELFINGAEYANAYSELNDAADQRRRMEGQARALQAGDEEAQPVDGEFCTGLEYGLPPTAGWGLGIDRLVMLLSGHTHIRDVIAFPVMKPQVHAQQQKDIKAPLATSAAASKPHASSAPAQQQ